LNTMILQEAIDCFIRHQHEQDFEALARTEACFDAFADYLLYFSDLFHDEEEESEGIADWEQELQDHMEELLDGDVDQISNLGVLKVADLESGHLCDFVGWYLPRMQVADTGLISDFCTHLREWLNFVHGRRWLPGDKYAELIATLLEQEPESARAVKAAQLLLHYVRLGRGIPARLRTHRFSRFHEGHARLVDLREELVWLQFDGQSAPIGPVMLAKEIVRFLQVGDVLDLELGLCGDTWLIVDIGPVYPNSVYVEAEELQLSEKIC